MRYSLNKNKYLLDPEIDALLHLIIKFEDRDPRNTLLLEIALRTGARAQEILNLRKDDVNTYDQSVFIRGIKGSNDREIPLNGKLFKKLERWLIRVEGSKVFDISYQRLNQIWDNYRPCPKKFHSLRHTFAILLYKKTKDIRLLQVALGHRNINNTMVYADYIYSKDELKRLIL